MAWQRGTWGTLVLEGSVSILSHTTALLESSYVERPSFISSSVPFWETHPDIINCDTTPRSTSGKLWLGGGWVHSPYSRARSYVRATSEHCLLDFSLTGLPALMIMPQEDRKLRSTHKHRPTAGLGHSLGAQGLCADTSLGGIVCLSGSGSSAFDQKAVGSNLSVSSVISVLGP